LTSISEARGHELKWSWKGAIRDYHLLHSKDRSYAILFPGAKGKGSVSKSLRSLYFIGICLEGEFKLEGSTQRAEVRRMSGDCALVANWNSPNVEFMDGATFSCEGQEEKPAKVLHFVKDFRSIEGFIDQEGKEQIAIQSEGINPKLWVNQDAETIHLPVLILLSGWLQRTRGEESAIYTPV